MTLSARNLHVRRGNAAVLRGIDASAERGQITAICGPNGAGKSTLLAALAGLDVPAIGEVLLDGEALGSLKPVQRARRVGYLPQDSVIAWDVSVASLLALGRLPSGDAGQEQVEQVLQDVRLADFAQRPVSSLSGGERARALLGRVLVGEPQWILADEPLAALDLHHQLAMLKHLRSAADAGAGVVLVLHDLALAMNHADHVLVLGGGQCLAQGPPQEVLSESVIAKVWDIEARWLREAGTFALAAR